MNGIDPLRDEGILYALRLMEAGLPVGRCNAQGCYQGAEPLDPPGMAQAAASTARRSGRR